MELSCHSLMLVLCKTEVVFRELTIPEGAPGCTAGMPMARETLGSRARGGTETSLPVL